MNTTQDYTLQYNKQKATTAKNNKQQPLNYMHVT